MFAVIFEVEPKPDRWQDYLDLAGSLRPDLEKIDGFIANDRFRSRDRTGRVLSLSIWRDEKAVIRWRTLARHHQAQARGRAEILADYHLRVGEITTDSELPCGQYLPQQRLDETEIGVAKLVTITELGGEPAPPPDITKGAGLPERGSGGVVNHETFSGINDPEKVVLLVSWSDATAARGWHGFESYPGFRHRAVRIIRDYKMHDRREAPQYYPPVGLGERQI
jgi:heme-degrading monooxygenase HmoA